jgi:Ca2+-binding EF-hand superfamily protein
LINKCYDKLDKNGDGMVTIADLELIYDVSSNPDVVLGKKSKDEVYSEFINVWDSGVKDGIISREEFEDYFRDVSAGIDKDEEFAFMLNNCWKIQGFQQM